MSTTDASRQLISFNVNGIRAIAKKGFFEWVQAAQPYILGLQETKIQADQLTKDLTEIPGYTSYWSHAEKKGYSGTALFCKEPPLKVWEGLGVDAFDHEGRTLVAEYPDFVLYNIYFPNGQMNEERLKFKLGFYDAFLETFNRLRDQGKRVIVCGDFNTAHKPIDLARPKENEGTSGFLPIERAWMDKFVDEGYIDTFRHYCCDPDRYSWWNMRARARERNVGWRIDYFFAAPNVLPMMKYADIHDEVMGSDHCPVSLTLAPA